MTTYANILVETHGRVGLVRLNRPQALNALNSALIEELNQALSATACHGNALSSAKCRSLSSVRYNLR